MFLQKYPFTLKLNVGEDPPFVGVAVTVIFEPAQTFFADAKIETEGTRLATTFIVI